MPDRPNILYLHSHDTGRHIEPYGAGVRSPNLQRLAGQGVTFRRAFSAAPTCSPSRASLLTGQWPHQTGMLGLAHRGFALGHPDVTSPRPSATPATRPCSPGCSTSTPTRAPLATPNSTTA